MKIGNTNLPCGLLLAPMAGVTDRTMRHICGEFGCEYAVSEMVSAKAIVYEQASRASAPVKTATLCNIEEGTIPTAVQIFGSEPEFMAEAARLISNSAYRGFEGARPDAIDINMGCPVKKVVQSGDGSALMKNPELIHRITEAVVKASSLPVTVKIRAGWSKESKNAVECALAIEEGGADMITVHGRTRVEMYSGKSDRNIIKEVKENVKIPVIANGDIKDAGSAEETLLATGADGLMIGRASVGNPFLFEEIRLSLDGKAYTPPTVTQKAETALRQLRYAIAEKGENLAVREARKQIALYLRSFRGSARLRAEINTALSYAEVERAIYSFLKEEEA